MWLRGNSMNLFRLAFIVACFSILCALFSGIGSALEQNEADVSLNWSSETLYPGSNATVTVFFVSRCSEELAIYLLGLHFDWMASDNFATLNMSDSPVVIPSNGTHVFDSFIIHIPERVSVGTHDYFVRIGGLQENTTYFTWEDPYTRTLQIQGSEGEINNEGTDADSQQNQSLIIVGVVIVVVGAVLITVLMRSWKKKKIKHPS
jgi:hypothetical protein